MLAKLVCVCVHACVLTTCVCHVRRLLTPLLRPPLQLLSSPPVISAVCGNGLCESPHTPIGESCGSCPLDCGPCQSSDTAFQCVEERTIALTFDDGPGEGVAEEAVRVCVLVLQAVCFLMLGCSKREQEITCLPLRLNLVVQGRVSKHRTSETCL